MRITKASTALKLAKQLIADPKYWCQYAIARNDTGKSIRLFNENAVSFCAIGAKLRVSAMFDTFDTELTSARRSPWLSRCWLGCYLQNAAKELFNIGVSDVNDYIGHDAVMQCYDLAIANALKDELQQEPTYSIEEIHHAHHKSEHCAQVSEAAYC